MDGIHSFKFSVQVWKSLTKKLIDAPLFLQNLVRNAISTWVDNVFVSPQEATVLLEQIAKFKQIEDNDRLKRLTWANEIEPLVKIKCNGPTEEQFIGCFIGSCVGDACGFTGIPNEIISSYAETDKLFEKFSHVTLENGYKFGQITNNSRFSAELLLSFIHNKGKFVPQDFAFRLSSLLLKDSPSPEKCDQATLDAVNAINNGVPWYRSGAIVGNQNCAAVRSVCIGALCWNDHQLLTRVAVDQSSCTHNTSITRAGAVAIATAVALAIEGIPARQFIHRLSTAVRPIDLSFALSLEEDLALSLASPSLEVALEIVKNCGKNLGDELRNDGISSSVVQSVLWAIFCYLKSPTDFLTCVMMTIRVIVFFFLFNILFQKNPKYYNSGFFFF
eukprot:TRINITY_DN1911_c0_g3_i21.p1 TRINITY_DN1911_c0_g3~~TRINITY_DN1911_c0_g3_i21.p1  ORF type:complete len:389 (-),score=76.88 TRINITY_DN1911_c0_g3_i21:319-1485(-)